MRILKLFFICAVLVFVVAIAVMAADPSLIDPEFAPLKNKPILAVALPPETQAEIPTQAQPTQDPMRALAPQSMSADQAATPSGFGLGFGHGNGGGIGGGGLGAAAGQLVQEARVDQAVRVLTRGPLSYPEDARRRGISGSVIVKVLIQPSGEMTAISVVESTPPGAFDQAALSAVRNWRFAPALRGGQAVAEWSMQKIRFELN
ncbi:MAG: energy transducer TonB [Bdellovibrionales bacterium]